MVVVEVAEVNADEAAASNASATAPPVPVAPAVSTSRAVILLDRKRSTARSRRAVSLSRLQADALCLSRAAV